MAKKLFDVENIVALYVKVLASQGIRVEKIILFGSQARGTAREDSDIDIVVISSDLKKFNFPERLSFLSRATLHIPAPLEVIGYTPEEIEGKDGTSIFWDEINATGKTIYKAA